MVVHERKTLQKIGDELNRRNISFLGKPWRVSSVRLIEAQAALAYWSAWRTLPINYPKNDLWQAPDHWRSFGTRISPLTGSPRLAATPPNSIRKEK